MSIKTIAELKAEALAIKTNEQPATNTHLVVGGFAQDVVDTLESLDAANQKKEAGKGLSTNDYDNLEKGKVATSMQINSTLITKSSSDNFSTIFALAPGSYRVKFSGFHASVPAMLQQAETSGDGTSHPALNREYEVMRIGDKGAIFQFLEFKWAFTSDGGARKDASLSDLVAYINAYKDELNPIVGSFISYAEDGALRVVDSSGNIAAIITPEGKLKFIADPANLKTNLENVGFEFDENGNPIVGGSISSITEVSDGDPTLYFIDQYGNIGAKLDPTGKFDVAKLGLKTITDISNAVKAANSLADVNHIISYGQSLSVGETDRVVTTTPLYSDMSLVNFDGHSLTSDSSEIYPNNHTAFAALTERSGYSNAGLKETPVSGMLEMFARAINTQNGRTVGEIGKVLLGSAPGKGSTTIAQLSKGTAHYQRVIDDVFYGKKLSNNAGKSYKCLAICWIQGENDYTGSTTQAAYKASMLQLKSDLNTDIKNITGQVEDVIFITYQIATAPYGGAATPTIAMAQLDCALTAGTHIAPVMYNMGHKDGWHLLAQYSKLMGSYFGYQLKKIIVDKEDPKPVHIKSATISTNTITATMWVPVAPLVFEAVNGITLANKGFKVMKASVDILTSVAISGNNIVLTCSESPVGAKIQYGFNSTAITNTTVNLGNLRDSQGETVKVTIDSVEYKLHNWCAIQEYQL